MIQKAKTGNVWNAALIIAASLLCLLLGASTTFADEVRGDPVPSNQKVTSTVPDAGCGAAGTIIPGPNEVRNNDNSSFTAISAVANNDIWAVGHLNFGAAGPRALVRHWNGTQWTNVPVPNDADSVLSDVDAIAGGSVWIVGHIGNETLTLRWDGVQFIRVPSPNVGTISSSLSGVDIRAADDVWAVGGSSRRVNWSTTEGDGLAMHWDGSTWTVFPSISSAGDGFVGLSDVSVISADDAWAVGTLACFADLPNKADGTSCPDPGYMHAVTLHWNGSTWTRVFTGHGGYGTFEYLSAVHAISSDDVWAVGQATPAAAIALHWNGTQWSYVNSPANQLIDVSGVGSDSVWAIGHLPTSYGATLLRWDGQNWTVAQTFSSTQGGLYALSVLSDSNVYLAGYERTASSGRQASAYRWNGAQFLTLHVEPQATIALDNVLRAVDGSNSTDIWAVGHFALPGGTLRPSPLVRRWNGAQWSTMPPPNCTACRFNDVKVVSANNVWVVGHGRSETGGGNQYIFAARWNGTSWTPSSPNSYFGFDSASSLEAIDSISAQDIWTVGYYVDTNRTPTTIRPTALKWNGTWWDNLPPPDLGIGTDARLYDVKVISSTEVWAVGTIKASSSAPEQTLTLRWNGAQWTRIPSPNIGSSRNILRTVTGSGPADVWAAGYYGPPGTGQALYLHWNGTAWSIVPAPQVGTDSYILSLEQTGPNNVVAVGNYLARGVPRALVERWNGAAWIHVDSPSHTAGANYLWGAYVPSADEMWSVGSYANEHGVQQTLSVRFTESLFYDMPPSSTFYPYVKCLVERTILSGYADCTFRPNNDVTRGQLSKIVSNSANFQEDPGPQIFEDVPPGSTFYDWVQRLARRGHISGYSCGSPGEPCISGNKPYFRPNANATRAQISKIVSNARGYSDPPGTQIFEDLPPSHSFYEWIQRLARAGAMGGYECGGVGEPCVSPGNKPYFRPNNNATRGQTSKIVSSTFFPECNP